MAQKLSENPGKRQQTTAQRRAEILEAALICFLENGYHQTGVRDIAKRAGVSLGNLYNHFPGKHDVLAEIAAMERADLAPFLKMLVKPGSARAVLEKFIKAYANYLAAPETVMLSIEISSEAVRKPDIGALFLANREALVTALASVMRRGVEAGEFRKDLDPNEASQLVIELIDASAYRSALSEVSMRKILGGLKDFIFAAVKA